MQLSKKAQDVSTYLWSISYVQSNLAKFKGLSIKIKVMKGFSAKLKVLKDCNQIKGFKGSTRGPVNTHRIFKRLAMALIRLRVCAGWSEPLLVTHTTWCIPVSPTF